MLRRLLLLLLVLLLVGAGGRVVWRAMQVEPPMQKAERLIEEKKLFEGQVVLRGIIKAQPRDVPAHLLLAQTQIATADWISAEKEAKTLRALGYDRSVVSPILVQAYARQGRYQDILADVPPVASKPSEQYLNLTLRSRAFLGLKDLGLAQQLVDAAGKLEPDAFLVHLQKARVALARRDLNTARQEIDRAAAQEPMNAEALALQSRVLSAQLNTEGAIAALDRAIEVAPKNQDLLIMRAGLLLSVDADGKAKADVDAVFAITPTNSTALFYNAELMLRSKQYADANVEFDKLGGAMDQYPRAYYHKAEIALALGNRQSALDSLDRYLRLLPGDSEGIRLSAEIRLRDEQPEQALAVLAAATGPGSRDAIAFDLQGRAYFMLGKMPEALGSYRRAATIAPENKDYATHLAAAQTQFGMAPIPGDGNMELPP